MRRSTAWAGASQRTRASSVVSLGATETPSAGWGWGRSVPSSSASSVATSSSAPLTDSRCSRSPAVSRGRMVSVAVPSTGPVSMPSSSRNVVAPVTSSPAMMACCTGAAPRQAGRTEKCRFTHPRRGTARTSGRSRCPYATTGAASTASSRSRATNSSPRGTSVITGMPASSAAVRTGLGTSLRPRPAGASARVRTATTSWREPRSAWSDGTAGSGVPAKRRRTGPV